MQRLESWLPVSGSGATLASAAPDNNNRPDSAPATACMHAGFLPSVAADGLPIATAVSVGVIVGDGAGISGVPDPIPFNVVLADHRAGDKPFVHPCVTEDYRR